MEILGRRMVWIVCAALVLAGGPATAQNLQLAEQKIKAGMLYNFLKYTNWPAVDASPTMAVCIFGDDPFAGSLEPMRGRSVNQRNIAIRLVSDVKEAASCQLLIINQNKKDSWPQLHAILAGKPVVTVSDYEGFTEAGGMIEFGHQDSHITVELNPDAVAASGLSVQPRLRSLTTTVRSRP